MRILSVGVIAALLAGTAATPASAGILDEVLPGRLVVGLTAAADPSAVLARIGDLALASRLIPGMNVMVVDVPPESRIQAGKRATGAGVRYAQPDATVVSGTVPADPTSPGSPATVRIPAAHTWTAGSPETVVAVVDTGVNPGLQVQADRILPGHDVLDGDADATDADNHGTLVAGVVGAVCPECRILPVRALEERTGGTAVDIAAGIVWAADHGARVISVGATTSMLSYVLKDAAGYAAGKGALLVSAAGSTGIVQPQYPGEFKTGLTVGSVDSGGLKNSGTNENNAFYIDVAAVDNLNGLAGTSASAAVVAGSAALAFAAKPGATVTEVRDAVVRGATPSPERHYDPPILDAGSVLNAVGPADKVAPTVISTGLTTGQLVAGTPVTVRPVVTDDHAVTRVELVVKGTVVAEQHTPWAAPMRLAAPAGWSGQQPVTVRAYDYAGNVDEATTVVRFDTVTPTVRIVSPQPGAVLRNPVEVVITTDADVTKVLATGVAMTRRPGTATWTAKLRISANDPVFSIDAYDAAGHIGSTNWTGRIDDSGPTVTAVRPAQNTRVLGTFTTSLTGVTDNAAGVARAELWANGRRVDTGYSVKVATGSFSGNVNLVWKLTDRLGNVRTYHRTVIADNRAPSVSITKAPKHKAKVKGTVKVSVKAADAAGIARVELIVNGKVVARDTKAGYVLSLNAAKQKKTMKVQVRAYDSVGNVKYTSIRTWYRK